MFRKENAIIRKKQTIFYISLVRYFKSSDFLLYFADK
jgi:hypothetical protein